MEISRSRLIAARPDRIWPFVDDLTKWPEWFTEAEKAQVMSGQGVGRTQRMWGHARGRPTEIDSTVTAYEPNRRLQWHHTAERVNGKPGAVVYAKDAVAEVTIEAQGDGSLVTYHLTMVAGGPLYWLIEHLLARGPITKSFDTSLERLDRLVTSKSTP